MDPFTIISAATAIAKATGLSDWLGRKIGGDKGAAVAEKVLDVAGAITGGKTPEEIVAALEKDQQLAHEIKMALINQAAEIDRLEFADIKDARDMQKAALAQDDIFSKRFVYYLATFWSILTAAYIGGITFGSIPEQNVRFADTILGFLLGTIVATIMNYFYGSSRGSHGKDGSIASMIERLGHKLGK